MKTLYKVEVSGFVCVYADSPEDAEEEAKYGLKQNDIDYMDYDVYPLFLENIKGAEETIPWGDDVDCRTCREILTGK